MVGRPSYLPNDTFNRARAAKFADTADRDIWALSFNSHADTDIEDLASLIEIPDPAPKLGQFSEPEASPFSPSPSLAPADPLPIVTTGMPTIAPPPARVPLNEAPEAPVPTPSGTPAGMPTAPRTVDATITSGPRPGQQLQPGESVGTVALPAGGDIEAYIRKAAAARGINPDVAVAVARSEGGLDDPVRQSDVVYQGRREESYGPLQLNVNGGVGTAAIKAGIDPRNPAHWQASIDFGLDEVARAGWGQWHGAARVGIGNRQGLETAKPIGVQASTNAAPPQAPQARTPVQAEQTPAAQRQAPTSLTDITPAQYGLGDADADSICGPVLAMAFARSNGRNPTIAEAKQMAAKNGGWTRQQGMGGPEAMAATLRSMDIPATYKPGPIDIELVRRETANGNPVGINTPGHYYVVEGVDSEGRLNLGNSAANALKSSGGRRWFYPHEIADLGMGAPTGVLIKDAPSSPTPSAAVQETGLPPVSLNTGAASSPAAPVAAAGGSSPASGGPEQAMWSPDGPIEQGGAFQASTGRSGGSGVMMRAPLDTTPVRDRWADDPQQPFDPDQGPREAIPGSVGASPVAPPITAFDPSDPDQGARELAQLTYNDPTAGGTITAPIPQPAPSYVLQDGRTTPPTPQGTWVQPQTVQPYDPRMADEGPRETGPLPFTPLSANAEPVAQPAAISPYDAPQPWRPTLTLGSPPQGPSTPPAAPNAELDAPIPYGPPLSEAGPAGTPEEPTTWYGRAGQAALTAIAPALAAYDAANEWLINNPVTGTFNPQAMGRELAGADQISREVKEDQARLELLIRRFRAGDTSVEPEIQSLTANLNARTGGGTAGLLAAGERNPDKGAETAGQIAQAALTFGIAPSAGAGAVRNAVGAAMDPIGQGIGLAADAVAPVVRGARAAGRRVGEALNAGADAPLPSSLGSGFVPDGPRLRDVVDRSQTRDVDIESLTEELQQAGAKINADGTVTLYHRTSPEAAQGIRATGTFRGDEDGIFFATRPDGQSTGYGEAVVEARVPIRDLMLDDVFGDEAHLRVPTVRAGVDYRGAALGDAGRLPEGEMQLGSGLVPESRRFYHGTAGEFGRPDPGRFDENGLFGPGYYLTSDPRVASSYANERARPARFTVDESQQMAARIADEWDRLGAKTSAENLRWNLETTTYAGDTVAASEIENMIFDALTYSDETKEILDLTQRLFEDIGDKVGANVRAVDVPSNLTLIDGDKPIGARTLKAVTQAAKEAGVEKSFGYPYYTVKPSSTGQNVHAQLVSAIVADLSVSRSEAASKANEILTRAGFDGIKHQGGNTRPITDNRGRPIKHSVTVVFPDALPRIRNAFSGEAGGSGFIPSMSDARNAAQGGVVGAASEGFTDEELTPQERLARIGAGAALGVAAGRAGRGAAGRRLGSGDRRLAPGIMEAPNTSRAAGVVEDVLESQRAARQTEFFGETPFIVYDKNGTVVAKVLDENYADNLAQSYGGRYELDPTPQPLPPENPYAGRTVSTDDLDMSRYSVEDGNGKTVDFSEFSRAANSPEQRAAREAAQQPNIKPGDNQLAREEFGRPWEEVAPIKPGNPNRLGPATEQLVTDGQKFRAGRNRAYADDVEGLNQTHIVDDRTISANNVAGGLVGAGAGGVTGDEDLSPQERAERMAMGAVVGAVFNRRPAKQAAAAAADPIMARMARMMDNPKVPTVANARGLAERWAQAWTDDRAGLRTLQEAVSAKIGRPLGAGEMVADLTRRNGSSIAGQRLAEELRPALVKVGDDDDYLAQYLVHSHNVDVAREIGQRTYDEAIKAGKSVTQAGAEANRAANSRQFSGDLTLAETQAQLAAIQQRVSGLPDGATRWQNVQDAAQAVWDTNKKTLERKRDAGIITTDLYNELTTRYPKYVRTDIADYFDKGAGAGAAVGPKRVGLSDIGVQKISAEGTTKERVNPLLSTLDQTYAAESAITKNEAGKAFEELLRLDPAWQSTFKEVVPAQGVNVGNPATTVPSSYKLRNGEQFLKVWDGGDARTFVVPQEYAALVSPQTGRVLGDSTAANAWRNTMQVYKSLITSKNPAFSYLVSPVRDLGDYAIQEATESAGKSGGLKGAAKALGALPGIMTDYARAVPDAFAGLTEGVYKGDLAAMMRNGAGMGSRPQHNVKELRQAYEDLRRTNGMEVKSMGDLTRVLGNVLTLGAEPIGGRLEQVPRLAAARRAARRGANDVEQTMRFRDATVDFQRAGEWSRVANELVPFFNVAAQSGAQTVRAAKKNPAAAMAAVASVVGGPAVLAEVLNHRDEQTARDYEDVPDYLKKTGIVFMLPGVEGRNERGDRLPNYLYIPVGQYGALVQTAKETVQKVAAGKADSPDLTSASGWAGLAADIGGIFSPIRGDSAASAATSLIPPGLSTAADLAADTDLYRGSKISTDQRDENASALSQASAAGFNAVTGKETRPSQWEHTYRDLGGYAATLATTGSNMLAEAVGQRRPKDEDRPIQSAPVVGGLVNRVIRDTGGQRMEDARAENTRVPASIRPILEEAGMRREEITGVPSKYKGASLTREEQERWQEVTNSLVTREIQAARRSSEWRAQGADKQQIIREAVSSAREMAAERSLRRLNDGEIERRKRREASRKAS